MHTRLYCCYILHCIAIYIVLQYYYDRSGDAQTFAATFNSRKIIFKLCGRYIGSSFYESQFQTRKVLRLLLLKY